MAIVAAAASAVAVVLYEVGPIPIALPAATMTFGVVVSGFVATQRNMLLTMSGAEVLRFAVRTGYHQDVIRYLMDGIRAGLLVTVISLLGFFVPEKSRLWDVWLPSLAATVVLVICLLIRNEVLVTRMVSRFLEEQN